MMNSPLIGSLPTSGLAALTIALQLGSLPTSGAIAPTNRKTYELRVRKNLRFEWGCRPCCRR
jgi:hypothetical protein